MCNSPVKCLCNIRCLCMDNTHTIRPCALRPEESVKVESVQYHAGRSRSGVPEAINVIILKIHMYI